MVARITPYIEKLNLEGALLDREVELAKNEIDLFITNSSLDDKDKFKLVDLFNMVAQLYKF